MANWWETFFDADYLLLWEGAEAPGRTEKQVAGLWDLLSLGEGSKVLDAPCGYGRIARGLAERGAQVLGLDLSSDLLAEAQRRRNGLPAQRLRYRQHDLRRPFPEEGFDAALNIFSSLGYGSEADDIAVLSNLRAAVRPGGLVFVETMHRDLVVANLLRNSRPANRLPDGTLLVEEPRLDPVSGCVETTWYWSGPGGSGQKSASFRSYTATELVKVVEAAGLQLRSVHNGCSTDPFGAPGSVIGGRLGLLAVRE
jgi:SAM-dependent methyltransferase